MGRQFTLLLGPADQEAFDVVLKNVGALAILNGTPASPKPERLSTTVIANYGLEPLRVLLAREEDVDALVFEPIKGRSEFSCSPESAPIVEFDRCFCSSAVMRPGRLYFVNRHYNEDGELIEKSADCLKWTDTLFRKAKASLTRIEDDVYAGPDAIRLKSTIPISRF